MSLPLLTPDELAGYLGISLRTYYNWRSTGRPCPPAIKVGGVLRFRRDQLEAWLDEHTEQAQA
jgi:excisionase family DNA binding protein